MDIEQLRYFLAVCECGSISKAANKIQMSQQGLSLAIKRLESELSCELFFRKSNGVVLTEVGEKVKTQVKRILSIVDNINAICTRKVDGRTCIHVAIADGIILCLPVGLQQLLITNCSDFDVHLSEMNSPECLDAVVGDRTDFGIVCGSVDSGEVKCIHLDTLEQVIVVNRLNTLSQRDELTLADLNGMPFVLPNPLTSSYRLFNKLMTEGNYKYIHAYECDNPRQSLEIVSNNPLLITRTHKREIRESDNSKLRVYTLKNLDFSLPVQLVYKKGRELNIFDNMFILMVRNFYGHH